MGSRSEKEVFLIVLNVNLRVLKKTVFTDVYNIMYNKMCIVYNITEIKVHISVLRLDFHDCFLTLSSTLLKSNVILIRSN